MRKLLKLVIMTVAIVLALSVRVKNRTLFSHIYAVISPATLTAQRDAEDLFSRTYSSASDYTSKLFNNSVPKIKDSVKSRLAAPASNGPEEVITDEEKKKLDQLIKTH